MCLDLKRRQIIIYHVSARFLNSFVRVFVDRFAQSKL